MHPIPNGPSTPAEPRAGRQGAAPQRRMRAACGCGSEARGVPTGGSPSSALPCAASNSPMAYNRRAHVDETTGEFRFLRQICRQSRSSRRPGACSRALRAGRRPPSRSGKGVELELIDRSAGACCPIRPSHTPQSAGNPASLDDREAYCHNIENFVGTVKLPVGVIGQVRINGLFARGDFYVPLATTEAALVASHSRRRAS